MNDKDVVGAGGIAPLSSPAQSSWDRVVARHYLHPALGQRRVVRLVAEALGEAEDLTLEFHGFQRPLQQSAVGWQQRKGLGFPGWALVNDPDRAAFALEVVKEFRAQARLAKSRPGAARDGLEEIAARLGRSVPHFLPSFYEECGRAMIQMENANLGAQFFNKARQAEKVHALQVDEELRRESFLEFALAGAVSVKAISDYAAELIQAHQPGQAYHHFHELCLRRTLGGLPPWATMLKELGRLARAAGKDAKQEERDFLVQVLDSASVARAPIEFWSSASASLKLLCAASPDLGARLLAIRPEFSGERIKAGENWFKLLDEWGLLEKLCHGEPLQGGAAGWLQSMLGQFRSWRHSNPNPDALFQLVRRLAPRLRGEGTPLKLSANWKNLDLDMFELLADLTVPVDWSEVARARAPIQVWEQGKGPERLKDPKSLSCLEELWPFFRGGLDQCLGRQPFETLCQSGPGWQALRRRWFEESVSRLEKGALPGLRLTLERWERASDPGLLAPFPELQQRLRQLSLAHLLARSVSTLLAQELTWPAAEQAMHELAPGAADKLQLFGLYPNLVIVGAGRAIAVSPSRIEARHDLVMPGGARLQAIAYLEGRFLVHYYHKTAFSYWSDQPDETFDLEGYFQNFKSNETLATPEGGVSVGSRALRAGDRTLTQVHKVFADGHSCWRLEWAEGQSKLREFDPRTGQAGRYSMPSFLDDFAEPEMKLELVSCSLFPLPGEQKECLLGQSDGLTGWRLRHRPDGRLQGQGVDGREWLGHWESQSGMPGGLLQVAGGQALLAGRYEFWQVYHPGELFLAASPGDGQDSLIWRLPRHWWTLLSLRDARVSESLRRFDANRASRLLAHPAQPDIDQPELATALSRLAEHANACSRRLQVFLQAQAGPEGNAPKRIRDVHVDQLTRSLGLNSSSDRDYTSEVEYLGELFQPAPPAAASGGWMSKLTGLLRGKPAAAPAREVQPRTLSFIGEFASRLGALAWRSVAPFTDREQAEAAWELLWQWSQSPLLQQPSHFRRLHFRERMGYRPSLVTAGKSSFAVDSDYLTCRAIEYSPDGTFRLPEGVREESSDPLGQAVWDQPERIRSFVEEARRRGPRPWNSQHPARLAERTGLSVAEATLLLAGMPFVYNHEANFLPPALRESLGLKATDARAARETFRSLSLRQRLSLYNQAMPLQSAQLWEDPDGSLERLAQAWNSQMGRRQVVDEERLQSLEQLGAPRKPGQVLACLAKGAAGPLGRDGRFSVNDSNQLVSEQDVFDGDWLRSLVLYAAFLHEAAPAGDPLRQSLAAAWRLVEQRLANPHLLLRAGIHFLETPEKKANLFQAFGVRQIQQQADLGGTLLVDSPYSVYLFVRPALPLDPAMQTWASAHGNEQLQAWLVSRQPGFQALLQRLENGRLPADGYEANPLLSVPHLIPQVMEKFSLSQAAAVLYLQTLALARPSARNVQLWNGWTAPVYKRAAEELCQAGLLLEAKRARAGRAYFLPGGWETLRAPDLPVESFKLPFHSQILGRLLALHPLEQLFIRAWQLVLQGQGPAYEEVR